MAHGSQAEKCLPQNNETEESREFQDETNVPETNQYITPLLSNIQQSPQNFMSSNCPGAEQFRSQHPPPLYNYNWRSHFPQRPPPRSYYNQVNKNRFNMRNVTNEEKKSRRETMNADKTLAQQLMESHNWCVRTPKHLTMKPLDGSNFNEIFYAKRAKELTEVAGYPEKATPVRNGSLNIVCNSEEQSIKYQQITTLAGVSVEVKGNQILNKSKGVVREPLLSSATRDDIIKEFESQGVVDAYRFKKKINGELKDTQSILLTFSTPQPPDYLTSYWMKFDVHRYNEKPRKCFNCQMFGHGVKYCKRDYACPNCSENHDKSEEKCEKDPKCINCDENHNTNDKSCEAKFFEEELISIRSSLNWRRREIEDTLIRKGLFPKAHNRLLKERGGTRTKQNRKTYAEALNATTSTNLVENKKGINKPRNIYERQEIYVGDKRRGTKQDHHFQEKNMYKLTHIENNDSQTESEVDVHGMAMWRVESSQSSNDNHKTTSDDETEQSRTSSEGKKQRRRKRKKTNSPEGVETRSKKAVKERVRDMENTISGSKSTILERNNYLSKDGQK